MSGYLLRHLQVFFYTLGQLARAPLASLMTIGVIGITLALPGGLYLVLENIQRLSTGWESDPQISVFMRKAVGETSAKFLAERIRRLPEVKRVTYVSPEAGLAEVRQQLGFSKPLKIFKNNPLPAVLIVVPKPAFASTNKVQSLVRTLRGYIEIDQVRLDLDWIKTLQAVLALARRGVLILAGLLGLAVVLIISNTIRLAIANRREEIEIVKLFGGTNAFVRRPFLYTGSLQGLFGGITAWLLITLSLALLSGPLRTLSNVLTDSFQVQGLGLTATTALLGAGIAFGWLGAQLAVGRHLRAIAPK